MRDLMIGHRRSVQPRSWRAVVISLGLLLAAAVVAWFIFQRSVTYEAPAGEAGGAVQWAAGAAGGGSPGGHGTLGYRGARLSWRGGIAVLHLEGSGHALGAAHGKLLAEEVPAWAAVATRSLEALVAGDGLWAEATHDLRVDWRLRFLDDGLGESDRAAVAGMVRGAGMGDARYPQLARAQAIWDIGAPAAASDAAGMTRALAVIVPQVGASAGRAWLGQAFAAPGLDDGGEGMTPVVTFARPAHGAAWATVGWPGNAGAVFGINARGLALAVNPARTRDVRATRSARPILLLARAVLEQASTLDEAIRTLESTSTLGAASYLVVDGKAGKWAVVERSPARAVVTRSTTAIAVGDFLSSPAFAADPENDRTRRTSASALRVARAQELLRAPVASAEQVVALLRDRRSRDASPPLGHRGVPFDPTAQLALVDPSLMALWVSDGSGTLRAFDLRHELEGMGDRPAPPPDLAADPTLAPGALDELRAARRLLRASRRAHAAGQLITARQLADRAVARAPALPEALLLAGQLATAAGDAATARRLLQSWLDGSPDSPDLEPKVRAQLTTSRGW
jgi:isopenicillin-N N-acyltransferase like protein